MNFPKRGQIWFVSLDPVVGHGIGKKRPALVFSNDRNNQFAETVTVVNYKVKETHHYKTKLTHLG